MERSIEHLCCKGREANVNNSQPWKRIMEKLFINSESENYKSINMSPVSSLAWLCYSFPCNPENVIIKSNKNEIWKVNRPSEERCIYIVQAICSSKHMKKRMKITNTRATRYSICIHCRCWSYDNKTRDSQTNDNLLCVSDVTLQPATSWHFIISVSFPLSCQDL